MKSKRTVLFLLALVCLLSALLVKQTVERKREHWQQGILTLNNAAFFLVTVMPSLEDPADWDAGATALGQIAAPADVQDKGDNWKVREMIQAVANSQLAEDKALLREAVGELAIAWNTQAYYCTVEQGDPDRIIALCRAP